MYWSENASKTSCNSSILYVLFAAALHMAALKASRDCVQFLLQNGAVDVMDADGKFAIDYAVTDSLRQTFGGS